MNNDDTTNKSKSYSTSTTVNVETELNGSLSITLPLTVNIAKSPAHDIEHTSNYESLDPKKSTSISTPKQPAEKTKPSLMLQEIDSLAGYNENFIDPNGKVLVPMPTLTLAGRKNAAPVVDGGVVLRYNKFSIVMHAKRRFALFTIANIDWKDSSRRINGVIPNRKSLLSGSPWRTDPRLVHEQEHQLHKTFYEKDRGAFERGHLVHRASVCWGESLEDIKLANRNTYFMTNCTPQIEAFNQSSDAVDNWGDHEIMIAKQSDSERIVVVAGPVLDPDDPKFLGLDKSGATSVQIPRKYWKIVVSMGEKGPQAFGFMLEQNIPDSVFEFVVPPRWKMFQTSIENIEKHLFGAAKLTWYKQYDQYSPEHSSSFESISSSQNGTTRNEKFPYLNEIAQANPKALTIESSEGFIHGINFNNRKVTFEIIEGRCIFEGDIDLGDLTQVLSEPENGLESIAIVGDQYRWPNKTIPYDIDPSIKDSQDILDAITHWQKHTPIKFVARDTQADFLTFHAGSACKSSIGRQTGQQFITLSPKCTIGNIIHEIGHAVGLWHEHSRSDRDDYITINKDNIQRDKLHNFSKRQKDGTDIGIYDYNSIMHYGEFAFSTNEKLPTITTRNGEEIGQREGLSKSDISTVKKLYGA